MTKAGLTKIRHGFIMSNNPLLTKTAADAFCRGDYQAALSLYREAGNKYGNHLFQANIDICLKRIKLDTLASTNLDYASNFNKTRVNTQIDAMTNELGIKGKVRAIGYDSECIKINLTEAKPILFKIDVTDCDHISIAPFIFSNSKIAPSESAVICFRFIEGDGTEKSLLHPECSHSKKYPNYLYHGEMRGAISLNIPENIALLEVLTIRWKAHPDQDIAILSEITIFKTKGKDGRLSKWQAPGFKIPEQECNKEALEVYSILDEFSDWAFSYDLNLIRITPENWKTQIETGSGELLLVESAWMGNNSNWQFALTNPKNDRHSDLLNAISLCKLKGIPTIFWNKEDPPNFDKFIDIATKFDYVFTTDINCIPLYQKRCGHNRIYPLPFFAQPKIHNPVGKTETNDLNIAFAGTWYAKKHMERCELAPVLFDTAIERGLVIFNRMSDWTRDDTYDFPSKYRSSVVSKISYKEMLSAHKMFKIFLNINSVIDSPTMFSRRIFEVLASSTPVISTESIGLREMFKDIVPIVTNKTEANKALDDLLDNPFLRKKTGHQGYRLVMQNHTCLKRIEYICSKSGVKYNGNKELKVTWAVPTNRPEHIHFIVDNFKRQSYKNIELIVALNSDRFDINHVRNSFHQFANAKIIQLPESATLGEVLNATIDQSSGDVWMKIDDDNIYMDNFTSDMLLPYNYTKANIVGKGSYFAYLEEADETILRFPNNDNKYVTFCSGSALAVKRSVFSHTLFPSQSVGEDTVWMKECLAMGETFYSPDIFNYVVVRRKNLSSHTWKANPEQIKKNSIVVGKGLCLDIIAA
jgi:spore maturation protein CgeB